MRGENIATGASNQTTGDTGIGGTTSMPSDPDLRRRSELALFLKAKRAAITPDRIGLRPSRKRRARGLLREEVAQRAGISVSWYTWLEQGRDIRPSDDVLEHLADALLLDEIERRHLKTLARSVNAPAQAFPAEAPAILTSWINGLNSAAYVLNARCDLLAWNEPASEILGDLAAVPPADRNILRMIFLWPHWRQLFVEWDCVAASAVAQFRAETARHAGHADLETFLLALMEESEEFRELWNARNVAAPRIMVKRINHPTRGLLELTYAPLRPPRMTDDLSVIVYSPLPEALPAMG